MIAIYVCRTTLTFTITLFDTYVDQLSQLVWTNP